MTIFGKFIPMLEVLYLRNLALIKSVAFIVCIVLNTKTFRLNFVSHVVRACLMIGMIYQPMFMTLLKVGSIILREHISTTKNMSKNKNGSERLPFLLLITAIMLNEYFKEISQPLHFLMRFSQ